jgi:hypothetical protein
MSCFFGHDWGEWDMYEERGRMVSSLNNTEFQYCETRQRRRCKCCGYSQDRKLKDGPMVIGKEK